MLYIQQTRSTFDTGPSHRGKAVDCDNLLLVPQLFHITVIEDKDKHQRKT